MAITINGSGTVTGISATGISAQPVFPGNILQVVNATYSTQTTSTSSTYIDTGLSASITPSSTSSKVLVLVNQSAAIVSNTSGDEPSGTIKLVRNSTDVFTPGSESSLYIRATGFSSSVRVATYVNIVYLDSPSSVSSIAYKTQQRMTLGTNFATQQASSPSTITLLEIAA